MAQRTAERSGSLVETHKGYDPRIVSFYPAIAVLLLVLVGGLAYRQLFRADIYGEREKQQNQRRILVPGPRGNIYDRNGQLLVGNRPRFAVTLYLDELRKEFRRENIKVMNNYRDTLGTELTKKEQNQAYRAKQRERELPSDLELLKIARYAVVQRYLDQINVALGRNEKVNGADLERHFYQQLLLPYILVNDLSADEYAKLIEQLPVTSPLQVYAFSARYYPHGSAAAQTLGYVAPADEPVPQDFPGKDLPTFPMKGLKGQTGLEARFENTLKGETGGAIFRVDPAGYKVNPPLEKRLPVLGHDLTTSLDLDLQTVAEETIGDQTGAAVALDVNTGEVLVMASKPDYDANIFSPQLSHEAYEDLEKRGAWRNQAVQTRHAPGSTFKILTAIAGLRSGAIAPDYTADCEASMMISGRRFTCENGLVSHGVIALPEAIARSCDIYFYTYGLQTTADVIAAEARRFHLDRPTGLDFPSEARTIIPNPNWKFESRAERWFPGDTANMSIGQGFVTLTPMHMACFVASVARGETVTVPTLVHDPQRFAQRSEPLGLTREQYAALLAGMEGCTKPGGTAADMTTVPALRVPNVRVAGKTGTAQVAGNLNVAWFICFAPLERPEIAIATMVEGDIPGETFAGSKYAMPVASAILRKYFEKKSAATTRLKNAPAAP
jgi:penicillin-binding protein 2